MEEIKIHCQYTELCDAASLVPNPRNPNRHPKRQIELLAKIIQTQGWRQPVTVSNRSGFIVRGHGRLEAAMLIGCKVPVERQDYASEAEEWADLVADNRIAEPALVGTSSEGSAVRSSLEPGVSVGVNFFKGLINFLGLARRKATTKCTGKSSCEND